MSYNDNFTESPYAAYYDEDFNDTDFSPCETGTMKNFGKVFLPTVYSLVFVLGFLGNGLVVVVLMKHRNQTNLTDIYLFNLAVSDIVFVLTLPFYCHYSAVGEWTFGNFMCRLVSGCHNTGYFSSIFLLIVMTLDRYVVIVHAHSVARYRTLRAGFVVTSVVWLVSVLVSLPSFILSKASNETGTLSCSDSPDDAGWKRYKPITTNLLGLVVPLLVMVACYARIIPTLVNMRTVKKHRVVKLIVAIVVVFFLCWAPYNISVFLRFLTHEDKLQYGDPCIWDKNLRLSVAVTETIAYIHCCLNPIIYAFVRQKFMNRAMQLLNKCIPWLQIPFPGNVSDSSYRKSSVVSRSSENTSNFAM
ncbi:C-C chemokine receptor type 1-like isoform X1 [Channa argus]|uniref:C-C chemokine receptor type 1-like isoform X1 n=2 Tax=Channa argus TaxID=215402 RepID=UPI0035209FCC